jgi:mono/diheme cytochrome c family protein
LSLGTKLVVVAAFSLLGCGADSWSPDELKSGSKQAKAELKLGREGYVRYCQGCHGMKGDGKGDAARHFSPLPRDFRVGRIKFALVSSGKKPRAADYLRVITNGLAGTAMPSFALVPLRERRAIVRFIKTFDAEPGPPGVALVVPKDPYRKKPAKGVRAGERLYHATAQCYTCHPAYVSQESIVEHMKASGIKPGSFRPNMFQSEKKESDWGPPILPPDFLRQRLKMGASKEDIVRVIVAGVGGTAMPTWGEVLTKKQLWSLAYYVESLAKVRGTSDADELRAHRRGVNGVRP